MRVKSFEVTMRLSDGDWLTQTITGPWSALVAARRFWWYAHTTLGERLA